MIFPIKFTSLVASAMIFQCHGATASGDDEKINFVQPPSGESGDETLLDDLPDSLRHLIQFTMCRHWRYGINAKKYVCRKTMENSFCLSDGSNNYAMIRLDNMEWYSPNLHLRCCLDYVDKDRETVSPSEKFRDTYKIVIQERDWNPDDNRDEYDWLESERDWTIKSYTTEFNRANFRKVYTEALKSFFMWRAYDDKKISVELFLATIENISVPVERALKFIAEIGLQLEPDSCFPIEYSELKRMMGAFQDIRELTPHYLEQKRLYKPPEAQHESQGPVSPRWLYKAHEQLTTVSMTEPTEQSEDEI